MKNNHLGSESFLIPYEKFINKFYIKNIFIYYYTYKFNKIRYYGKTYRFLFYKKFIMFRVGRSHLTNVFFNKDSYFLVKKKKNLIYIKTKNKKCYEDLKYKINKIKKINMYTKRGVRLNKYKFNKRYGKVSQAFMGLH